MGFYSRGRPTYTCAMDLGALDICLRVRSAAGSREFYEKLGFERVEGNDQEGWAVVVNGTARIGLFEPQFMDEDAVSLNFRGGDVPKIVASLAARAIRLEGDLRQSEAGASAKLRDPDGYLIFLDSPAK